MDNCQHDNGRKPEEEPIGRLVYQTTMALKHYLEAKLRPYDLTMEQFQVMKALTEEQGVTQGRLCEVVIKSPANMTRILDRLEKKGYLERRDNPDDRRSSLVYLTESGIELMGTVKEAFADCHEVITDGISESELTIMRNGLKTICRNTERIP